MDDGSKYGRTSKCWVNIKIPLHHDAQYSLQTREHTTYLAVYYNIVHIVRTWYGTLCVRANSQVSQHRRRGPMRDGGPRRTDVSKCQPGGKSITQRLGVPSIPFPKISQDTTHRRHKKLITRTSSSIFYCSTHSMSCFPSSFLPIQITAAAHY